MPEAAALTRLPWPGALAALAAFATLGMTGRSYVVVTLLGLGIAGSYVSPARLAADSWSAWIVRVLVFLTIIAANVAYPMKLGAHGLYDSAYVHAFGELLAAELAIQYWRERPSGGRSGVVALLLSGFVFLVACNTFGNHIAYCAPVYLILTIVAVRFAAPRRRTGGAALRRLPAAWLGTCAIALALAGGAAGVLAIRYYKEDLNRLVRDLDRVVRRGRSRTGFSERPVLGRSMSLEKSMLRVLRIEGDAPSPHLRGLAFDTYAKGVWGPHAEDRETSEVPVAEFHPDAGGPSCRITRLEDGFLYLFAPLHAKGLAPERVQEIEMDLRRGSSARVNVPAPYSYEVRLPERPEHQGPLCKALTEEQRLFCLAVPSTLDPRVLELAHRIGGQVGARARIAAVEAYLREHHNYSLTVNIGPGDPVSDFLVNRRNGHCEYFASAAVILLRAMGIPARYVAGFYAHEKAGEAIVVRQQDAHAWAEAWIEGEGWITVEATPPAGQPPSTSSRPLFWRSAWEWINDTALAIGDWLAERSFIQLGMLFGGLASFAIVLLWLREQYHKRRRRLAERPALAAVADPALAALAARFEALLARAGHPCPAHTTWHEHLAAAGEGEAQIAKLDLARAAQFVAEYNRARFGAAPGRDLARLEGMLEIIA